MNKKFVKNYLARDFDSIKSQLIEHASLYYPDKIKDFSEASIAGLFMDMAAIVGDSMSYYMDHQFRELDPLLAVEPKNILIHLRNSGIKNFNASPSVGIVTINIRVPAEFIDNQFLPKTEALPTILKETKLISSNGIEFNLVEDIDFSELDYNGRLVARYIVDVFDENNTPAIMLVSREAQVVSGTETSETFKINNEHVPFREITLNNSNVTDIISVMDEEGNEYYEVESLSQDVVYARTDNILEKNIDSNFEKIDNLEIKPAPRRFVRLDSFNDRTTKIRFGSGDAHDIESEILTNPSKLALSLKGKKTLSKFSINPSNLLKTQSLGISPRNTNITINYRYGGGLSHNIEANTINRISSLSIIFKNNPNPDDALFVRRNIEVFNEDPASGGQNPPSLEFLKSLIPSARSSQNRIVSRQDLISRIYTLPAEFGKVYRVSLSKNPNNPLSTSIYIISLDIENKLAHSPDILKINLSKYLNEFRLISESYNILDANIINFGIEYDVYVDRNTNRFQVLQNINRNLMELFDIEKLLIDKPLIVDNIVNTIINTRGVISLRDLRLKPKSGLIQDRNYSNTNFKFSSSNTKSGIIRAQVGSIFEIKYPEHDIIGSAS